ncbi:MAG: hypothetical protein JSW61_11590 [Candidatus Thorarchaeota archaeon]|nr:MAG: hypothetical protein JSW61_11590 [Candidatus Thorarchaeota archaeon]
MKLEKHNIELAERIEMLDNASDIELARELMELHSEKCKECQEDRLSCTVRPACTDRNFLNALIELGVEAQDLPSFCYSKYLEQIAKFVLSGKGKGIADRRIPEKDLLSTLKVASIRQFNTKFGKIWDRYAMVRGHNVMLVAGDELLFHFDFRRGVVILNPWNLSIEDVNIFDLYVEVLSKHYGLSASTRNLTSNWWSMTVELGCTLTKEESSRLKGILSDRFEAYQIVDTEEGTVVEIEVVLDQSSPSIELRTILAGFRSMFELVAGRSEVPPGVGR